MSSMNKDYDTLVGSIYDCAANPELWPDTLGQIRDTLGAEYCLIGYLDMEPTKYGKTPFVMRLNSPWNEAALDDLQKVIHEIPQGDLLFTSGVDVAWTQMSHTTEEEFHASGFFEKWAKPNNLRDTVNVTLFQRELFSGALSAPRGFGRDLYSSNEARFCERISPHIRRAVLINDLTDKGHLALTLYKQVLDRLSVAVFIVGLGQRLIFTNDAGDQLLSKGEYLHLVGGSLQSRREAGQATGLEQAVERALKGDAAIGITGIGVPLIGNDGDRAAAYVLPLSGKDVRGSLGTGHCAVFVARRGEQQPMAMEILRTLFDLTVTESRVALLVAKGDGPQSIAVALGITVNTVRTHLKHSFAKTGTSDQTALGGLVNGLLPPV
jgi:DNA-binding CsgD family transcriptional regulator